MVAYITIEPDLQQPSDYTPYIHTQEAASIRRSNIKIENNIKRIKEAYLKYLLKINWMKNEI